MLQSARFQSIAGIVASILLLLMPFQAVMPVELSMLETFAVMTYAWSVWLLAKNNPFGWWRGGQNHTEKPVGHISRQGLILTAVLAIASVFALRSFLIAMRGAAPFWNALTTVMSLVAHLYLMGRLVESWYLWIMVDVIYVPLYASRQLPLTSMLYGIFGLMALSGLRHFQRLDREQQLQAIEP